MTGKKGNTPQLVVTVCLCIIIAIELIFATGLPERLVKSLGNDQAASAPPADNSQDPDDNNPSGVTASGGENGNPDDLSPSAPTPSGNGNPDDLSPSAPTPSGNETGNPDDLSPSAPTPSGNETGNPDDLSPSAPTPSGGETEDPDETVQNTPVPTSGETLPDPFAESVNEIVGGMTLEQKVAQMFMITPSALTGYLRVTAAGKVTQDAFAKYPVGGIIYMSANLVDSGQTKTMLEHMQQYSKELLGIPVFLGVDEEGGTVARIARNDAYGIKNLEDMCEIGESRNTEKAYEAGCYIGNYLSDLGFNLDFAPVADVWSNEKNTVVKYRSFGADAKLVRDMVSAELKGLNEKGILAVAKHFPGHGSTAEDSHNGAAIVNKTLQELRECDLIPFIGAIESGVPLIMVGHLSLPQVTENDVPAVLSPEIITELLRGELGYHGIVITDALNMEAITDHYTSSQAAILAVQAGADILLMPEDFTAAYQGLLNAVQAGKITEERIDESVKRIVRVKISELQK